MIRLLRIRAPSSQAMHPIEAAYDHQSHMRAHRGLRIGPVYRVHIRSRRAGRTGHATTEPWDWLFEQDRKKVIWITFIRPGLYRLDDWFMASAYLIEAEKKALLIDTTMTHAHVDEVVKRIPGFRLSL